MTKRRKVSRNPVKVYQKIPRPSNIKPNLSTETQGFVTNGEIEEGIKFCKICNLIKNITLNDITNIEFEPLLIIL